MYLSNDRAILEQIEMHVLSATQTLLRTCVFRYHQETNLPDSVL